MIRAVVLFALLAGCSIESLPPDGEPLPRVMVDAAIATWELQGLPIGNCREKDVYLLVMETQAELQAWCELDETLYACTGGYSIAIIDSCVANPAFPHIIEHELRHWMSGCGLGTVDGAHAVDKIWYPDENGYDVRSDAQWGNGCAYKGSQ